MFDLSKLDCNKDWVPGACGVTSLNNFGGNAAWYFDKSGCGWYCAGFINNEINLEFYNKLKSNYKIVFQTPVRINNNSSNEFIFVVYDSTQKCENAEYEFPWNGEGNAE